MQLIKNHLTLLLYRQILTVVDNTHHRSGIAIHEHEVVEFASAHLLALLSVHLSLATVTLDVEFDTAVLKTIFILINVVLNPVTATCTLSTEILSVAFQITTEIAVNIGIVECELDSIVSRGRDTFAAYVRIEKKTPKGGRKWQDAKMIATAVPCDLRIPYDVVLKGDISFVGPRSPLPREVANSSPKALQRLSIIGGLTCYWQISGRSTIDFDGMLALDERYIRERGILTDLKILVLTIPAVIRGDGAY